MFEDILGDKDKENSEIRRKYKKPKSRINLNPKEVAKRANKIRKEIKKATEEGVSSI